MLTITFAFVVATCLFFWFPQTRALGVVGIFVLLCINPVLFGALFALGAYVRHRLVRRQLYPLPTLLPKDKKNALLPLIALPWLGGSIPTTEVQAAPISISESNDAESVSPHGDVQSSKHADSQPTR